MNRAAIRRLTKLRSDYAAVVGSPFKHFYCPILFRDEEAPLCRAHIINTAFRGAARRWTIQREDVDAFYGSTFESDFIPIQERGKHDPLHVCTDKQLTRSLEPRILINGKEVPYYIADGEVPLGHSEFLVTGTKKTVRLGLKLQPTEAIAALDAKWEICIEKDVRLAALASLLKAAHLTLFDMLGYQYALSAGGHLFGHDILGKFFLANVGQPKADVLRNAERHFLEFVNLVRPDNVAAIPYQFEVDFHNQLKARLLGRGPTQIVRESTLDLVPGPIRPKHDSLPFQAAIAWNICTAAFYKAGGRPWKAANIRDGVCYVGLVFKRDDRHSDPRFACCAAQMFLDSGDGLVFRGAVGPWYSDQTREYHLTRRAARELGEMVLEAYRGKHGGQPPAELFIHGRAFFDDEEWQGFSEAVAQSKTRLVGVRIRDESAFRLYRLGERAVLRGTALILHEKAAFLMTRGHVPRLRTQVGLEVPRPLRVDIARGEADVRVVLADILSLTKLNYNACIFADGLPVTLRFADDVGEILTAGPIVGDKPLQFKHYI